MVRRHRDLVFVYALAAVLGCTIGGAGRVAAADRVPAPEQSHPVVLVGGAIHPVEGPSIARGTISFAEGTITALGGDVPIPEGAERIDIEGLHVYPGLIACGTHLGLVEIDAVRATRDQSEVGDLNPNVRAEVSVNPESELVPVARANGIALALSEPAGGLVSGSSALLRLDGWTWEEMVVRAPVALHVRWPALAVEVPGEDEATRKNAAARAEKLTALRALFEDAAAYRAARATGSFTVDLRCEALLPCLAAEVPVAFHAVDEREIHEALDFAREHALRAVIAGGRDAALVAERLRAERIPVIFGPVHALPGRTDDPYDTIFTTPARLRAAQVEFAIASFETSNMRNLPYHAATAAAYGLDREAALAAITLAPARILGVADRYGSLAAGKSATLIVTNGDPLEIPTQVQMMWIDGRPVDLTSRHTDLYEKYRERLRR